MRCHNHAAAHALGPNRYLRVVVEAAYHLAFWTLLELIGRQVQACLNERMIKRGVLLATSHKSEPGQVREHSSRAVLAVEPE
jgi:hypothetical protein